jgi:hypothetical protein
MCCAEAISPLCLQSESAHSLPVGKEQSPFWDHV